MYGLACCHLVPSGFPDAAPAERRHVGRTQALGPAVVSTHAVPPDESRSGQFFFRVRLPSPRLLLVSLGAALAWGLLWYAPDVLIYWGRKTCLGPGLVGMVFPLLGLEAWTLGRRHWRPRLLHSVSFAVPWCNLLVLGSLIPGSCCFCDNRPWARALRNVEFLADVLYGCSIATVPALVILIAFGPSQASSPHRTAHRQATQSTTLTVLLLSTSLYSSLFLFKLSLSLL